MTVTPTTRPAPRLDEPPIPARAVADALIWEPGIRQIVELADVTVENLRYMALKLARAATRASDLDKIDEAAEIPSFLEPKGDGRPIKDQPQA